MNYGSLFFDPRLMNGVLKRNANCSSIEKKCTTKLSITVLDSNRFKFCQHSHVLPTFKTETSFKNRGIFSLQFPFKNKIVRVWRRSRTEVNTVL